MADKVKIQLNGRWLEAPSGAVLAAALYAVGQFCFRKSDQGEPRGALCGMGICFECRVTIDSQPNCRSCQVVVREGMVVETA